MNAEQQRLAESRDKSDWKQWGPYLSERSWGTVREDYSADGSAWTYFPHDHARSRAYRWNEDGLLGICDRRQLLCFALTLWNGNDPILKERSFGLIPQEANHGEDIKEYFFYLDSAPTHSYMKALYKYPHAAYPYNRILEENKRRGPQDEEFELLDTGIFDQNRYFDVQVEYAKASPTDVLIRITAFNRGPEAAPLLLLPTLWFRNTWSWKPDSPEPSLHFDAGQHAIRASQKELGNYALFFQPPPADSDGRPLFTGNETNFERLFQTPNRAPFVKDAFHRYFAQKETSAVNPALTGTKAAVPYWLQIPAGESRSIKLRLTAGSPTGDLLGEPFDQLFQKRRQECDEFYSGTLCKGASQDLCDIQRQAFAGLLWSKQFYNYDVRRWLEGDPAFSPPPDERWNGRNSDWMNVSEDSVMSIPDKWEFPWYAAWDLAFHTIPLSIVDPDFAKRQLILLLRDWFMHPSGQLPAYEWNFGDVNPPVHAWAALRVFRIERRITGKGDYLFLERVFQKLLINFTWWINRKDVEDRNIFQGGFLGLDNIGLFDRNNPPPGTTALDQSDATAWMAMFCLNMLAIAIELAYHDPAYEDLATKFLEHYFNIAHAMNDRPSARHDVPIDLWDDQDNFYYDVIRMDGGRHFFLRVRSVVGLLPLLAVETIEPDTLSRFPDFARRLEWFLEHRPDLCASAASVTQEGIGKRRLFSVVNPDRLRAILTRALDESEFLSPHGLRSLSRSYKDHPARVDIDGHSYYLDYEPGLATTPIFGGNSNWRGPVWFPINYLIIESLQKFDYYYADSFKIECPTGSGKQMNLWDVATELSVRLINIFTRGPDGKRAVYGPVQKFQTDPFWKDHILFHEFFDGDTGRGLGAAHQTGWTALVAKLIQQSGNPRRQPKR